MKKKEYYELVKKYGMHVMYNNAIECMAVGHYVLSDDAIPELDDIERLNMNPSDDGSVVIDVRIYDGIHHYRLFPSEDVLGEIPHGAYYDGNVCEG